MNLASVITYLYPDAKPLIDFVVLDNGDGNGQFISEWNIDAPQPSEDELSTTWLNFLKKEKKEELNNICDDLIFKGFVSTTTGHHYGCKLHDQLNLKVKIDQLKENPEITTVVWNTDDVGPVTHTREEFLAVFQEGMSYVESLIYKCQELKALVDIATTEEEINSIVW